MRYEYAKRAFRLIETLGTNVPENWKLNAHQEYILIFTTFSIAVLSDFVNVTLTIFHIFWLATAIFVVDNRIYFPRDY